MNSEEIREILNTAEPELPAVDRQQLVAVLTRTALRNERRVNGSTSAVALVTSVVAVSICFHAISLFDRASTITLDERVAEYERVNREIELLEQKFEVLSADPTGNPPEISSTLRASESLWMVMKSADASEQFDKAASIVAVFPSSPAARKCLQEFPDLVPQ